MSDIQPVRNKKFQEGGRPAAYLAFLPSLFKLCEGLGYNLCVHGSLCRDFDMVAIAWVHNAVPAMELISQIAAHTGGLVQDSLNCDPYDFTKRGAEPKPHGRYAWTIHLGGGPSLDVSIIGPEPDAVMKSFDRMDESRRRFENAKVLRSFTKPSERVQNLATSLFSHIKHGDQEQQDWLQREALVWCAANFTEPPVSTEPNGKCKFASKDGAKCVHHCGDQVCVGPLVSETKMLPVPDNFETQLQLAVIIAQRDSKEKE